VSREDGPVRYDLFAFSRPNHFLTQLVYGSLTYCRGVYHDTRRGRRSKPWLQRSEEILSDLEQHPGALLLNWPVMNATTHAVFGVAALTGSFLIAGEEPPLYTYPATILAAWLPDVDNPRSRLGNGLSRTKNPTLNLLIRPMSWVLRATSFALHRTVGHRTLTHSLLGIAVFVALASILAPLSSDLFFALVAGYVSHLVADALNTKGVPLLWPVGWRLRLLPGGVRSGGIAEFVAALAAAAMAGYGIYVLHLTLARAPGAF
jgi:inner membrane protein